MGNAYVDTYNAADNLVKAGKTVKAAKDQLAAAKSDPQVRAKDLKYYEAI